MREHKRRTSGGVRIFLKNGVLGLLRSTAFASALFWPAVVQTAFGGDEAVVLEESQIFGKSPAVEDQKGAAHLERPALSTTFPWEGEEQTAFNIPEEVLNDLTKPDPSHLSEETSESETERAQGN